MPEKDSSKIEDLPYSLRKVIYDEFIKIDLKEHDDHVRKLHDEGKENYAAGYKSDIPGLNFIIIGPPGGCEEVIVLMNMLIQETEEKNVMVLKFRIGEESKLLESNGINNAIPEGG